MVIILARFARYVTHSGMITRAMYQQLRAIRASCVATSGWLVVLMCYITRSSVALRVT